MQRSTARMPNKPFKPIARKTRSGLTATLGTQMSPPLSYVAIGISVAALAISAATLILGLHRDRVSARLGSYAAIQKLHSEALRSLTQLDIAEGVLADLPLLVGESKRAEVENVRELQRMSREKLVRIITKLEKVEPSSNPERMETLESLKIDFQALDHVIAQTIKSSEDLKKMVALNKSSECEE